MFSRILISGASGFVGAAVARELIGQGHQVRVLLRKTSRRDNVRDLPVEIVIGDLGSPLSLTDALEGCQALFHVAADYRLWVPVPAEIYANNVDGTRNIMQAALDCGVHRVVYTSSVATLGVLPGDRVADEDTPVSLADMIGHYKRSKYLAEALVQEMVQKQALPAIIVNPSTPVGVGDIRPTPTGKMVLDAAAGHMPAYVDTGLNIVDVDDVARGHVLALYKGQVGQRYILGESNISLREILAIIACHVGRQPPRLRLPRLALLPVAFMAERIAAARGTVPMLTVDGIRLAAKKMYFSSNKARVELGYEPRPAAEALRRAVDWYRENGHLDGDSTRANR